VVPILIGIRRRLSSGGGAIEQSNNQSIATK
jgi:hypothetical protein